MKKGQISIFFRFISLLITVVFLFNCSGVQAQQNIPIKRILPLNALRCVSRSENCAMKGNLTTVLANRSEFQPPESLDPAEAEEQEAEEAEGFGLPAPVLMIAFSLPSLGEKLRNIKKKRTKKMK